jgi:ABC-2 type transport system permease protein
MSAFGVLLKKQFQEWLYFFKKRGKKLDWLGLITSVILTALLVTVFLLVFITFIRTYTKVSYQGDGFLERQHEILTITYSLILFFNIISGVRSIENNISSAVDLEVLIGLPIGSQTLFLSKIVGIFLNQLFNSLLFILPINLVFGILTEQSLYYILVSLLICLIVPVLSLIIAAFLAIPYHYFLRFIKSRFVLLTSLFTILIVGAFMVYSWILKVIQGLLETGVIKFIFDMKRIRLINTLVSYLYPGNLLSGILLRKNAWGALLIILAFIGIVGTGAYFLIKKFFLRITQGKLESSRNVFKRKRKYREKGLILTLMNKEFVNVLRTPNYSFQYFAVTLTVPLMVYTTMSLTASLITKAIGLQLDFELAFFIIIMFNLLTNTFCATNISRDGRMFQVLKTLPIGHREIILSKVLFSALVSFASIFFTVLVMIVAGYITVFEGLIIFITTALLSLSVIFFATRKDLNRPRFPTGRNQEIKEETGTVSLIVFMGLLSSLVIGALILFARILVTFRRSEAFGTHLATVSVVLLSLLIFGLSLFYLFFGLKKKYYETE